MGITTTTTTTITAVLRQTCQKIVTTRSIIIHPLPTTRPSITVTTATTIMTTALSEESFVRNGFGEITNTNTKQQKQKQKPSRTLWSSSSALMRATDCRHNRRNNRTKKTKEV